jgi:hypothetical protein
VPLAPRACHWLRARATGFASALAETCRKTTSSRKTMERQPAQSTGNPGMPVAHNPRHSGECHPAVFFIHLDLTTIWWHDWLWTCETNI